jgi:hypothetical protein
MEVKSALRAVSPLAPWEFLVLTSVTGWNDPRVLVRLEGLALLENPITSSRIEPATFQLVAYCQLNVLIRGSFEIHPICSYLLLHNTEFQIGYSNSIHMFPVSIYELTVFYTLAVSNNVYLIRHARVSITQAWELNFWFNVTQSILLPRAV